MTKNKDLKLIYNNDDLKFYTGWNESLMLSTMMPSWQGLKVLEIGCGKGNLSAMLTYAGATVLGVDYAEKEIEKAEKYFNLPGLRFKCLHYKQVTGMYDVLVMQGVLEHLDDPWIDLQDLMTRLLPANGVAILSVPSWLNPRGFVYHTCRLLYGAKMSLTDLHYFLPEHFQEFADKHGYKTRFMSTDFGRGNGKEMIEDFIDRIPKACPDVPIKNYEPFYKFISDMADYWHPGQFDGANLGVRIDKQEVKK